MRLIFVLILLFVFTVSCDKNDEKFFGEIVETNDNGVILTDKDNQWQPRMSFSDIPNANFEESEGWPPLSSYPAYPNPMAIETNQCFRLKKTARVEIVLLFENKSRRDTLFNENMASGTHCWIWSGYSLDNSNSVFDSLSTGNYQLRIVSADSDGDRYESFGNIRIEREN